MDLQNLILIVLLMCHHSMSTMMMANVSLDVSSELKPSNTTTLVGNEFRTPLTISKPLSIQQSTSETSLKSFYGNLPLLPVAFPPPLPPQNLLKGFNPVIGAYVQPLYTRIRLGYGSFYYDGREAELRCQFPYNLRIVSNIVWNKMSDNLVHYLDGYRIMERTLGHTSTLHISNVIAKDLGLYECAVTGSFYGGYPVTYYLEVHFYPAPSLPRSSVERIVTG